MIPFILAAVGGYLIGDSMKSDATKMADGGMMAKGGTTKDDRDSLIIARKFKISYMKGEFYVFRLSDGKALESFDTKEAAIKFAKDLDKEGTMSYAYSQSPKKLFFMEDGGIMAKGGRITKGSKYIGNFRTTDGNSGYSIYEIVDTNYFSNKYGGSPNTIRHKVIKSSNPEKVGEYDESSRNTIQTLLKNGLWTKL
jgi:hypothetical protein